MGPQIDQIGTSEAHQERMRNVPGTYEERIRPPNPGLKTESFPLRGRRGLDPRWAFRTTTAERMRNVPGTYGNVWERIHHGGKDSHAGVVRSVPFLYIAKKQREGRTERTGTYDEKRKLRKNTEERMQNVYRT